MFQTGRTDEAIVHYRKALEIKPDNIAVLNNCAVAFQETGRFAEAMTLLQRACEAAKSTGQVSLVTEITAELERLNHESRSAQGKPKAQPQK